MDVGTKKEKIVLFTDEFFRQSNEFRPCPCTRFETFRLGRFFQQHALCFRHANAEHVRLGFRFELFRSSGHAKSVATENLQVNTTDMGCSNKNATLYSSAFSLLEYHNGRSRI